MNKQLAALCLCFGLLATLQPPARSDFNLSFGRHDCNHDGRWNYREFNDANQYYYRSHPEVTVINQRRMRNDFDRLDMNHDGYLNQQEVRTYRTWD